MNDFYHYLKPESIIVIILFLIVIITSFSIIKGKLWWNPILPSRSTVNARVVAKKICITQNRNIEDGSKTNILVEYYLTFEIENGEYIEFYVNDEDYYLLVEGDIGNLSFQGTRYIGFKKE